MKTHTIMALLATVVVAAAGCTTRPSATNTNAAPTPEPTPTPMASPTPETSPTPQASATPVASPTPAPPSAGAVKEFTMTSFYELADNKPKPQFSLKEMTVKKGDRVRVKITNTKGTHNFNIDEFNVFADTPLNQEVTVEFMADRAGDFIYYCAIPDHRALGQWGTLRVTE